jgi:hypothetical protein
LNFEKQKSQAIDMEDYVKAKQLKLEIITLKKSLGQFQIKDRTLRGQ